MAVLAQSWPSPGGLAAQSPTGSQGTGGGLAGDWAWDWGKYSDVLEWASSVVSPAAPVQHPQGGLVLPAL